MDMSCGTQNVRRLYRSGSLVTVESKVVTNNFDLVAVQVVRWDKSGFNRVRREQKEVQERDNGDWSSCWYGYGISTFRRAFYLKDSYISLRKYAPCFEICFQRLGSFRCNEYPMLGEAVVF
jgi:hypothetical protein